ncbi:MAG: hypothetical protein HN406_13190 [Lentisphaerae bacterium]|nr:hypothetical protein [Lentisphaerota bacterium]
MPETVWRCPEALVRLVAAPAQRRSHLLRVDVPAKLAVGVRAVAAYGSTGKPLPASVIRLGTRVVAVECLVPWARRRSRSKTIKAEPEIELYLLPGGEDHVPCAPSKRTPVFLERAVHRLTTRPFAPHEMVLLTAKLRQRFVGIDLPKFLSHFEREYWNAPTERRSAFLKFTSDLVVKQDTTMRFGARPSTVAWFVFLNGVPVASWRGGRRLPSDAVLGEGQRISSGLHRLEFFVVQESDETIPVLLRQWRAGEPEEIPPEELVSAHHPPALLVGRKDSVLHVGLETPAPQLLLSADGATEFLIVAPVPRHLHLFERAIAKQELWIGASRTPHRLEEPLVVPGRSIPELRYQATDELGFAMEVVFPARLASVSPTAVSPSLTVSRVPTVLAPDEPLRVDAHLTLDEKIHAAIGDVVALAWVARNAGGQALTQGRETVSAGGGATAFSVAVTPETVCVAFAGLLRNTRFSREVVVRLIRPSGFARSQLWACGEQLWIGQDQAVLVCDALQDAPSPQMLRQPEEVAGDATELAIVDDFWATAAGPDADLLPEAWFRDSGLHGVTRHVAGRLAAGGARSELLKFPVGARALAAGPHVALWAVGTEELRAGLSPRQLSRHLLFLAQASLAENAIPMFVTLPSVPGVSPAILRKSALYTKEIACRLGSPVVDAYSREKATGMEGKPFVQSFRDEKGTVLLSTPNNLGRAWLCRLVEEQLRPEATR